MAGQHHGRRRGNLVLSPSSHFVSQFIINYFTSFVLFGLTKYRKIFQTLTVINAHQRNRANKFNLPWDVEEDLEKVSLTICLLFY